MGEGVSIDEFTAELKRMSNGKDLITLEEFLEYSHKMLSVHRDDLEKAEKSLGRESGNHLQDISEFREKCPAEEKDEV